MRLRSDIYAGGNCRIKSLRLYLSYLPTLRDYPVQLCIIYRITSRGLTPFRFDNCGTLLLKEKEGGIFFYLIKKLLSN